MTDAPETIWARPDPYEPDWTGDKTLRSKTHVEYRRADLVAPATPPMPPTAAQLMSDPRVKALVGALGDIFDGEPEWPDDTKKELDWCRNRARAALTQLKEPKE